MSHERTQTKSWMTITFPGEACAFTCTWKTYLLLKRQFKNNMWMKGICQDTTPILGSFGSYRNKRSHDKVTLGLNAYFPKMHLMPIHIFWHWIADVKKKATIPLDQVIQKSCDTSQQKWKQADWAPQIHNQYLQSQALVSLWSHFSIHCILLRSPRRSAMLLIWQWICFHPTRPENITESAYH